MSPAETVAKFKVAPEFEVKLFAGEPQVVNPIAFTIDEKGRVWVVECFEYPSRTPKGKAPRDRIVILEDTDGDGVCDKRTVFAEGKDFPVTEERRKAGLGAFDLASGIEVGHGGVFVGRRRTSGSSRTRTTSRASSRCCSRASAARTRTRCSTPSSGGRTAGCTDCHGIFTKSEVNPRAGSDSDRRTRDERRRLARTTRVPRSSRSSPRGLRTPGAWTGGTPTASSFVACCVIPHLFHIVPGGYYRRQSGAGSNPYAYGYINEICDHTFHKESGWAHAGLISLDAPHIPEKYRDSVIFGSIHGCSLKRNVLKPNGSTFTASRADDFLQSGDKNVRPINLRWGPLGDIYMIDWHDQNPCHQAAADSWDYERGRVYRIQLKGRENKKQAGPSRLSNRDLIHRLMGVDDRTPWAKRTAARLLSERGETLTADEVNQLRGMVTYYSVEGLWALAATGKLDEKLALGFLSQFAQGDTGERRSRFALRPSASLASRRTFRKTVLVGSSISRTTNMSPACGGNLRHRPSRLMEQV